MNEFFIMYMISLIINIGLLYVNYQLKRKLSITNSALKHVAEYSKEAHIRTVAKKNRCPV